MRSQLLARKPALQIPVSMTPLDDDRDLVAAAKANPKAFAALYARYADLVYRYCYRRIGHAEAAADATAQVFMKALAAMPTYRDDARSFRSWLFAIAHNVLVDDARSRRPTLDLEEVNHVASPDPSVEEQVLSREVARTIHEMLAGLTPDQREVMELRLAGLSGLEIASVVGRSLSSVKSSQLRSMERLRKAYELKEDPGIEAAHGDS